MQEINKWLNPQTWLNALSKINAPKKRIVELSPQGYAYAGLNKRLLAATLDAVVIALLLLPFNDIILAYAYHDVTWDPSAWQNAASTYGEQAWRVQMQLLQESHLFDALGRLTQIQFAIMAVYSFVFWHFYGATPGKLLLRLKIVDVHTGEKLSDWQSILRITGYMLSSLLLGIGFFAIEWNRQRQGWHDKMARTAVISLPWPRSMIGAADRSNFQERVIKE